MLPILYKKSTTGSIQQWTISVTEQGDAACITVEHGQVGGKIQSTTDLITEGKNSGKKNATTAFDQAEKEALAKWTKQKKKGYVESVEAAEAGETDAIIKGGVEPMKAHKFFEQEKKIVYPAYLSRKLDGMRCLAVVRDGHCTLWTRTRKEITVLPHIATAIEEVCGNRTVTLDGEIYSHTLSDNFEELISLARASDNEIGRNALQYHIFDIVSGDTFQERLVQMQQYSNQHPSIKVVEQILVGSKEQAITLTKEFMKEGYEGGMIRNVASPYENKRSYQMLKIKFFIDEEFDIVGVTEGRGKMAGHAIFQCKTKEGNVFEVKLKGKLEKLKEYFENNQLWHGKQLTVKYMGMTKKNNVPRHPVGIAIRDYE